MNTLRQLSFHSGLTKLARVLHLSVALRKIYYWMVVPADQVLQIRLAGVDLKFYARTPVELRELERPTYNEEDFFTAILSVLRTGDVFFDIGSNLGKFVIPFAKVVGEDGSVIAFEPEARSFARLEENVQLNGLSNVLAFRKALGERDGSRKLLVLGKTNDGSSLLLVPGASGALSEDVDLVQGDRFRDTEELPVPRAIKIDVEGYEYFVLQGLKRTLSDRRCVLTCCEVHHRFFPPGITVDLIEAFIRACGFSSVDLRSRGGEIHMIARKDMTAPAA